MLKSIFYYLNPNTGLSESPKLDNRNKDIDMDALEEELDAAAAEEEDDPKKKKKKEEEVSDDEEEELDDVDEDDEDDEDPEKKKKGDEDDEEQDDDEEDDDEEEEKKRRKAAEEEAKKKQIRESQREALVQKSRNEQLTKKIREANTVQVTDEELKAEADKEGLDFELLDNFQKSMLKRTILAERKFSTVSEVIVEEDKVNEWADKVDTFLDTAKEDPKFSRLVGHEDEFKRFSMKETRRGLDFEDLARSFLFDLPAKKKHKGSLLLNRGGGEKAKRKQFTEEDTVAMRKVQPGRLTDLMKKGKIKIEI